MNKYSSIYVHSNVFMQYIISLYIFEIFFVFTRWYVFIVGSMYTYHILYVYILCIFSYIYIYIYFF